MMKNTRILIVVLGWCICIACGEKERPDPVPPPPPAKMNLTGSNINGQAANTTRPVNMTPVIRLSFSKKVNKATAGSVLKFQNSSGLAAPHSIGWANGDSTLIIQSGTLAALTRYNLQVGTGLQSVEGGSLSTPINIDFITGIDSSDKFPRITDDELLTKVQRQTFTYFWDFAHPVSALIRERNSSGDVVTSGGSGFGMMAWIVGAERGFVTRDAVLQKMLTVTDFLLTKTERVKGAYSHWINGNTGKIVPFSANDNGADIVETSFLAMGLTTARQYFNGAGAAEVTLRNRINDILRDIEWNFFRKDGGNVLYWHFSNDKGWAMNLPVRGWNECLVTYVMAASSSAHGIPASVYHSGFARDGAMKNGKAFYGITLPLGEGFGGPLFLAHYSFLGLNPNGLSDKYADYWSQNLAHSRINFEYCKANPKNHWGFSEKSWGLSASDIPNGYTASSPLNDVGVIAPTAAISSIAYTPAESMAALKFFYYTLGDKLWKDYGFVDAYSLDQLWFADSHLAIDQAPQIIMIENYRTKLLWNLFSSAPEVKTALRNLGFQAPYL